MPSVVKVGVVVSNRCAKSVKVGVSRRYVHKMYGKVVTATSYFIAHDDQQRFKVGDLVTIRLCAPISATKRWAVVYDVGSGE